MDSGGRLSSASTVSMILPVSAFEKPRLRRKSLRSSSVRATIRSRAALMPLMKGCGEELAKFSSAGRRFMGEARGGVFAVPDRYLLEILDAP